MKRFKDTIKKGAAPSARFGVDPNDPWSVKSNVAEETKLDEATEAELLRRYLLSRGVNPEHVTKDVRIGHSKSTEFMKWRRDHVGMNFQEGADGLPVKPSSVTGSAKAALIKSLVKGKKPKELEEETISEDDAQQHFKNAMDSIKPEKRNNARKTYNDARKGGMTHAAAMSTMWQMHKEDVEQASVLEDWQKVNKGDNTDGMSPKAVKAYRRENPGSKLKTAVTKSPSEIKKGSSDDKRRKSFCARMSGMKGPMKDENGEPTAKAKALSRWNCREDVSEEKDPCWDGYKQLGMKKKNGKDVPNCVPVKENSKQIDELNRDTIYSYNKKSEKDADSRQRELGKQFKSGDTEGANKNAHKIQKRLQGQERASSRLGEESEQLDEISIDLVKNYDKELKTSGTPKTVHKAIMRFRGKERAQDRIHSHEMKQMRQRLGLPMELKKEELSSRAKMLLDLRRESMFDTDKEDKSVQSYGKPPKMTKTDDASNFGDDKPEARAVMKGGTTMTGEKRDVVEIDPSLRNRPGEKDVTKMATPKKDK